MNIQKKAYLNYYFKSVALTFSVVIVYVIIISVFPVIGSIFNSSVPVKRILADNFILSLPLFMISVFISVILAIILTRITKRRKLILISTGVFGYVFSTFFSLLFMSDFHITLADFPAMLLVALYSMIAFSFIVIPLIVFAMLILEKWTRDKTIS